jgi:hypothetical protein
MPADELFAPAFLPTKEVMAEGMASRQRIIDAIRELGLVERAWELDVDGYTVLRPDEVGSGRKMAARLLDACLALAERKSGRRPDLATEGERPDILTAFGNVAAEIGILGEDPIFEAALLNRPMLVLIDYLLGESCALIHQSLFVKHPGPHHLPLHTDQDQTTNSSPFLPHAQVANATWVLTDFDVANGTTCFVPGSHKLQRAPTAEEATDLSLFKPVEAEAGSIILWHGNTWHGAFRRTAPGVRVSIVQYFGRWYLAGANISPISQEMLDRNPPRFAQLVRERQGYEGLGAVKLQAAKETLYG